ncbi:MAG: formate dehydrogenase accessory sulfurtransferase FdhD [Nocardioides sp.]
MLDVARAPQWTGPLPGPSVVRGLPDALRAAQTVFARTGGVHAAALTDAEGTLLVVREDIGRHNAVDKVTGARVLGGQPTAVPCVVVSGRAGFELVQKAVAAGIGTLVAVGAPSSLAVSLARASGIGLYGFTSSGRCVRYAWRLAGHPTVLRRRGKPGMSAADPRFGGCASSTPPTGTWGGRSTASGCSSTRRHTSTTWWRWSSASGRPRRGRR